MMFWIRFVAILVIGGFLGYWRQMDADSNGDDGGRLMSFVILSITFGLSFFAAHLLFRKRSDWLVDTVGCLVGAIFTYINLHLLQDNVKHLIAANDLSVGPFLGAIGENVTRPGFGGLVITGTIIFFLISLIFVSAVRMIAKFTLGNPVNKKALP